MNRRSRALELFEQALGLPAEERDHFLDTECGEQSDLRKEVEELLELRDEATDLLPDEPVARDVTSSRSHPPRLGTGTRLANRYEILEPIGRGGMGEVYRALDTRLDRQVAVKVINVANLDHADTHERFEREIKSVAALSHPNIMTLYDIATHEGMQFAIMEFIEGTTLRELIKSKSLRTNDIVDIAHGIAAGLGAAHACNIMHRDIKPENVLVTSDGHAKILDFGLARRETAEEDQLLTTESLTPGTIPYMSPEQIESEELTCATDVFSLGTVLFEMITGHHPFRARTAMQTMRNVSAARPPALTAHPTDLSNLVMAMLRRSAQSRPPAVEIAKGLLDLQYVTPPLDETTAPRRWTPAPAAPPSYQPSLIILPFQVLGESVDLATVGDGLVDNLTTVLTRVPLLSLTSRSSSFALKGQPITADRVRNEFGVAYMLEGSLQELEGQIRVNVQLIETKNGFHLWAQQFDCSPANAVNQLLNQILPRLEPQLVRAMSKDLRNHEGDTGSQHLLLQAISLLSLKAWHHDSFLEAANLLRRSVQLDPSSALTHAYLALIVALGHRVGLLRDSDAIVDEAVAEAQHAIELDGLDSNVLGLAGCALADVAQTERAIPILKNAIEFNPNNAQAHTALGSAFLMEGRVDEAIQQLRKGIALSPFDSRLAIWSSVLAIAYLQQQDFDQALSAAEAGCQANDKTYLARITLTAVHLARGESDQAMSAFRDCLRIKPDLSDIEISSVVGRRMAVGIRRLRSRDERSDSTIRSANASADATSMSVAADTVTHDDILAGRPTIAVLPLENLCTDENKRLYGDAIAQEVIVELSKLHWLFVIARASSFQFRGSNAELSHVSQVLTARYLLTGTVESYGNRSVVAVELCHAPEKRVIWADRFESSDEDILQLRHAISTQIVTAIETRIQVTEAEHAVRLPTENLDAWSAYHRGLWHMYRFNKRDNSIASEMFRRAIQEDPHFARAHAGLSFTHFQNAFLQYGGDLEHQRQLARESAERSLEFDPLDPFANLTMGRSAWLDDRLDDAGIWLDRSLELSPNYAFAHYNRGLVDAMQNEGDASEQRI